MTGARVLIEHRDPGDDLWFPAFEARVLAETESMVALRRWWWCPRRWWPKNGRFVRASPITERDVNRKP